MEQLKRKNLDIKIEGTGDQSKHEKMEGADYRKAVVKRNTQNKSKK